MAILRNRGPLKQQTLGEKIAKFADTKTRVLGNHAQAFIYFLGFFIRAGGRWCRQRSEVTRTREEHFAGRGNLLFRGNWRRPLPAALERISELPARA